MSKRKTPFEYSDSDSETSPIQIFELDASLTLATRVPSYLPTFSTSHSGSGKILSCETTPASANSSPPTVSPTLVTPATATSGVNVDPKSIASTSTSNDPGLPNLILSGEDALSEMWSESLSENTRKEYQVSMLLFLIIFTLLGNKDILTFLFSKK